jgi:hypothetical protein
MLPLCVYREGKASWSWASLGTNMDRQHKRKRKRKPHALRWTYPFLSYLAVFPLTFVLGGCAAVSFTNSYQSAVPMPGQRSQRLRCAFPFQALNGKKRGQTKRETAQSEHVEFWSTLSSVADIWVNPPQALVDGGPPALLERSHV